MTLIGIWFFARPVVLDAARVSAVLTALTHSDSVFRQGSLPGRCFPALASGSTSTVSNASRQKERTVEFASSHRVLVEPQIRA
jgi:hypothetical protein